MDSSICVQRNIANITTGAAKFFTLEVIATDGGGLETRKNIRIRIKQHNNACYMLHVSGAINLETSATTHWLLFSRKTGLLSKLRVNVTGPKKFTSVAVISLVAGIIAGAVIVLLMFLSIIFILRRRGSTEHKLHKDRCQEKYFGHHFQRERFLAN